MTSNSHSGREGRSFPNHGNNNKGHFNKSYRQNSQSIALSQRYPVNSLQEIVLVTGEKLSGRVFCTDEMTRSIVLQTALVHTTLATELRILSLDCVTSAVEVQDSSSSASVATIPLAQPLPKINSKTLEDRERRAIRLAEDCLRHINQNVSSMIVIVIGRLHQYVFSLSQHTS
jgi:hypothetical protein